MLNLAWGGFANGSPALQRVCVQAAGGVAGDVLEPTTAAAWAKWRILVHQDTGVWLYLDHSDAIPPAFRNIAFQQAAYDRYRRLGSPIASPPGQSNHGWARALDVTGFETRADVWASMNRRAPECGLSNATGAASGERWHWECVLPPTTTASLGAIPIKEGFLMALSDDQQSELLLTVRNLAAHTYGGGPDAARPDYVGAPGTLYNLAKSQIVRAGVKNSQIQELADTKTIGLALTAQVGALQQAVAALAIGQGVDPAAIEKAAQAGAAKALANLTLKAAG